MKTITTELLNTISRQAAENKRKRQNYNIHDDLSDPINRLLNALQPETYVQPHKHETPDKRELFTILSGKVLVVIFKDNGDIQEHIVLSSESGNLGIEIPAKVWHTLIALEKDSVIFEVKDGPYSPIDDKNFAHWAPAEGDSECDAYISTIRNKLKI